MKKIAIIINGISLQQQRFYSRIQPVLKKVATVDVYETRMQGHAIDLTARAVHKGYDAILAAGGDGTLNEVINGILRGNDQSELLPVAGLIPLGSANDYARTLELSAEPDAIVEMIRNFRERAVDIGKINFVNEPKTPPRYFINIADTGMGPEVVRRMLDSDRTFGTLAAYYSAIFSTFFTCRFLPVEITTPEWQWQGDCRVIAIAKGKYFGSGIGIAPDAVPDNQEFACTLVGKVSLLDFILQQGRLRKARYAKHRNIDYRKATLLELTSPHNDMWIEADGELAGKLPVTIELLPKRIRFLIQ
ncbi:MAG: diacylglycerol kinase family lipid kinase [Cyclobacteriaceae bacterium]|jgi:YegS/Rv2252/BmrU family lipid kinase|nr:diacylglycerol kinase family lipid kinase [Cyclobacteriaceae bacterium]